MTETEMTKEDKAALDDVLDRLWENGRRTGQREARKRIAELEGALNKISAAYNGASMANPNLINSLAKEITGYARAALGEKK